MLTPASPSASASSAIVPGRLATTIRSSRSGPPRELGLEQAPAVLAGGGVPGGDRLAVAAADQLGGLAQARADRRRPRRRPPRGCWRRCRPRSPGWRRRRGSCRGSSGPTSGSRSESRVSSAAASADERRWRRTCGRWLTVAISRSWASASIACGRAPSSATRPLQAVVEQAARALGRGQVPAGALEEVGAGVLDPGGLGAGQRVAADEALVVAERGDELALGRADVGDDASPGRWRRAPRAASSAQRRRPAPRRRRARRPRRPRRPSRRRGRSRPPPSARSSVAGSGSKPTTSALERARRAASPIEPPIRPTPRTAILIAPRRALDRRGEPVEHRDRVVPVDAGVGDRLAVGELAPGRRGPGGPRPGRTRASRRRSPRCRRRPGRRSRRAATTWRSRVLAAVVVGGVDHQPLRQAGGAQHARARPRRPAAS